MNTVLHRAATANVVSSTPSSPVAPVSVARVRTERRRTRHRHARITALLCAALCVAAFARVALGKYVVAVPDLLAVLARDYEGPAAYIVWDVTLPRTVLGVLTGIAFGLAGHLFQRVLRNPLASPDIMGVSQGSGLAAVSAIALGGLSGAAVTAASIAGGFVLMAAVILAAGGTRATIGKLVLTGVAAGSLTAAGISAVLTRADIYSAQEALQWLTGSLNSARWSDIALVGVCLAVLLPACAALHSAVDAMSAGDHLAAGLGVAVTAVRFASLGLAVLLVAVAAATVGPVAFVSFMSAPIARGLARGDSRPVHAALVGALLMVVADYVAAETLPNVSLPVGVVTAAAGAPVLLWLLIARGKAES